MSFCKREATKLQVGGVLSFQSTWVPKNNVLKYILTINSVVMLQSETKTSSPVCLLLQFECLETVWINLKSLF